MKTYDYQEAKKLIETICEAARNGEYDTREKFLAMLDENPDVATQGYNAFGKIFFWNHASSELYGYREHAVVNKDLFDLVVPEELRQFARDMIQVARKTGKLPRPSSCDLVRQGGEEFTVFSGHLIFQWNEGSEPEFYCVDIAIDPASV